MRLRFLTISILLVTLLPSIVNAQTSEEISGKIADTNAQIKSLEQEIAAYSKALNETQRKSNTLSNAIKTLDLTIRKLETQSRLTEKQIDVLSVRIASLGVQIDDRQQKINQHLREIADTVRRLSAGADTSPVEVVLSRKTLSGALDEIYTIQSLQDKVRQATEQLKKDKQALSQNKAAREVDKAKLLLLQARLRDQRKLAEQNKKDKNTLLAETKNREANYRALLEEKIRLKQQFESDLHSYEAKLQTTINFANLPKAGSGVLAWPLDDVYVTQYFGDTEFARNNAQVYNGHGHNGIDLRASLGTPVKAAGNGTVEATGNTDLGCPGGSYGNWVLIDHGTGLSSLYAHLSLIKVAQGESVARGQLLGYSGSTGYATGPHLHFTVYASQGVKITQLYKPSGVASKCPPMPVAPLAAYLNPLLYL